MAEHSPLIVILAGGSGTRFWPLSRPALPKQFLQLFGNRSLLQQTIDRIAPLTTAERVFVCASQAHQHHLEEQFPQSDQWILEPEGKNTSPAVLLAAFDLLRRGYDPKTPMIVLPADHAIADTAQFRKILQKACQYATSSEGLILLGMTPTFAHTGFGYIEQGPRYTQSLPPVFRVQGFEEKPTEERAAAFIKSQRYLWNGGIFVWTLEAILEAFATWNPEAFATLKEAVEWEHLVAAYATLKSEPVDKAILEKADNVYVIPSDIGWSDLGAWGALREHWPADGNENYCFSKEVLTHEANGCVVHTPKGKPVVLIGVKDLVIVENEQGLLICPIDQDQKIKLFSEKLFQNEKPANQKHGKGNAEDVKVTANKAIYPSPKSSDQTSH